MKLSGLLLMTALLLNQSAFASFEAKDSSIGNAVDPSDHGEISAGFTIGITSDTEENNLERLLTEENDLERFLKPRKKEIEGTEGVLSSKQAKVYGATEDEVGYYSSKSKATKAEGVLSSKQAKVYGATEDEVGYYSSKSKSTKAEGVLSSKQAKVYGATEDEVGYYSSKEGTEGTSSNEEEKSESAKFSEKSSKGEKKSKSKKSKASGNHRCKAFEKLEADNMMKCTSPCSDDYLTCENGVEVEKPMPAGQRCYENKGVLTSQGQCVLRGAPSMVVSFDLLDACTNYPELEYCATDRESGAPYNGQFCYHNSLDMNGTWYWKDNVIVSFGLDSDDDTGEEEWNIVYHFRFGHDKLSNRTRTYIATTDYGTTRVKNWKQVENVDGVEGDYNCKDDVPPDPITLFVDKVLLDNPALFVIVDGEQQLQSIERSEYTAETTVKAQELGEEYMKERGKDPDEDVLIMASSSGMTTDGDGNTISVSRTTDSDGNTISVSRPGLMYLNFFMFNQSDFLEDGFDFSGNVEGEFNEALIPEIRTILQHQLEENRTCDEDFDQDWTSSIEYKEDENGNLIDYEVTTNGNDLTDLSVPVYSRSSLLKDFNQISRASDDEPDTIEEIIKSKNPLTPGLGLAELCAISTLGLKVCENMPSPTPESNQGSNLILRGRRNLERSMTKRRLEFSGDIWAKREYESFFPEGEEGEEGEEGNKQTCTDKTIKFTINKNGKRTTYSCGDIAKQKPQVRFDNCGEEIVGSRMLVGINCPKTCKTCKLAKPSNPSALFDAFSSGLEPAKKQELLDKFLGTGPGLPEAQKLLETFQKIDTLLRRIYGFGEGTEDGIIMVYDLLQSLEEIQPQVKNVQGTINSLSIGANVVGIISQIKPFIEPIKKILKKISDTLKKTIEKIKKMEVKTIKPTKPKVQKALRAAEKVKGAIAVTAYVSEQLFIIPINTTRNCESVDAMAKLVNEATREATTKILDVAEGIEGFFDQVAVIRGEIQKPIQVIKDLLEGMNAVVSSLAVLDPVVKPFTDLLDKNIRLNISFFWCTTRKTITIPYPCGFHKCCINMWWVGRVCSPCGIKWCYSRNTITLPRWCNKRFEFTVRDVIAGIQGVADIIMAPINLAADLLIKGVILLIKETTGLNLDNLPIPGLNVDIDGLELGNLLPVENFDDLLALPAPFDKFADPALIKKVLAAKRKKPKPKPAPKPSKTRKPTSKPTAKPKTNKPTNKPTSKPTNKPNDKPSPSTNSTEYDAAFIIETLNKFGAFKDFSPICESP